MSRYNTRPARFNVELQRLFVEINRLDSRFPIDRELTLHDYLQVEPYASDPSVSGVIHSWMFEHWRWQRSTEIFHGFTAIELGSYYDEYLVVSNSLAERQCPFPMTFFPFLRADAAFLCIAKEKPQVGIDDSIVRIELAPGAIDVVSLDAVDFVRSVCNDLKAGVATWSSRGIVWSPDAEYPILRSYAIDASDWPRAWKVPRKGRSLAPTTTDQPGSKKPALTKKQLATELAVVHLFDTLLETYSDRSGRRLPVQETAKTSSLDAVERRQGFELPLPLRAIYKAAREVRASDDEPVPLFRDLCFLPLSQAESMKDALTPYLELDSCIDLGKCFPIAAFDGAMLVVACGLHTLGGSVSNPVIFVHEGLQPWFSSIEQMLQTCIDWISHPDWRDGELAPDVEMDIWVRNNPEIAQWLV
jgi:hypothetical protein